MPLLRLCRAARTGDVTSSYALYWTSQRSTKAATDPCHPSSSRAQTVSRSNAVVASALDFSAAAAATPCPLPPLLPPCTVFVASTHCDSACCIALNASRDRVTKSKIRSMSAKPSQAPLSSENNSSKRGAVRGLWTALEVSTDTCCSVSLTVTAVADMFSVTGGLEHSTAWRCVVCI